MFVGYHVKEFDIHTLRALYLLDDGEDGEGESLDERLFELLLELRRPLEPKLLVKVHVHRLRKKQICVQHP